MTKEHPHAWALRLIADGVPASEFEVKFDRWEFWGSGADFAWHSFCPEQWQVRRKAKTIKVNGFDVPEPCKEIPKGRDLYAPSLVTSSFFAYLGQARSGATIITNYLKRGILHTTPGASAAHAKALLGIDPRK